MEEDLRRIAQENLNNRKKEGIAALITIVFTITFMIVAFVTKFQAPIWWILMILSMAIGFTIIRKYSNKIVGKKSELEIEVDRLKALYPDEKLQLPKINDSKLKLKEMIRRSNRDDMI
tara:strand:+ start:106 stop:459 length:354 start_codon:yes stop_codon:yes gene_type:complete